MSLYPKPSTGSEARLAREEDFFRRFSASLSRKQRNLLPIFFLSDDTHLDPSGRSWHRYDCEVLMDESEDDLLDLGCKMESLGKALGFEPRAYYSGVRALYLRLMPDNKVSTGTVYDGSLIKKNVPIGKVLDRRELIERMLSRS